MKVPALKWIILIACIGAGLLVLGGVCGWALFPYFVNIGIGQELALKPGSDAWDRFVELPLDLDMKFSIFNVSNPEEFMNGGKPHVQEIGPFVYKQHRRKFDVAYHEESDTISYHQQLIHTFDNEQSGALRPDDKVTVINPALLSMLSIMSNIPVLQKGTMFVDLAAPLLFPQGLFVTTTAEELLFRGVRIKCGQIEAEQEALGLLTGSPARRDAGPSKEQRIAALITCSSLKRIKVNTIKEDTNGDVLFALFMNKNDTYDGLYEVKSGMQQPDQIGQITAWEGKAFVSAWGGPTCNAVNGTQGDIFSPYITKDTVFSVFSTDICRSMSLRYVEDTTYRGIAGYRFAPGPEVMAEVRDNGNNYCFCPQVAKGLTKENGCLRKGALDLSGCQGIPVVVTYPHFYASDPFYLEGVDGLNPQEELHRMQLDIEPMTGTPLLGGKKMQLNFEVKQVEGVRLTTSVRNTLFPVAWMYEGAELNDEMLDLLNNLLFSKLTILDAVKYTMLALGAAIFVSGSGLFLYSKKRGSAVGPRSPEVPHERHHRSSAHAASNGGSGDVGLLPPPSSRTATASDPSDPPATAERVGL